jgi:hypothetical protein
MTIAAGFLCRDGIVICADTQETYGDLLKINAPKIILKPGNMAASPRRAVFAGAGHGPLIDKLAEVAWATVQALPSSAELEVVAATIEASIKETHEEFGRIFQSGQMPQAELIYGINCSGRMGLYRAIGPIVNPIDNHACIGIGQYLADYITDRMALQMADSAWSELLSIYLLEQAKEYISGCGGESHVVTIRPNGSLVMMDRMDVSLIGNHLKQLDKYTSTVLLSSPDLVLQDDEYKKRVEMFVGFAATLRKEHRADKEGIDAYRKGGPMKKFFEREKN